LSVILTPDKTFGEGTFSGVINEMITEHRNILPRGTFLVFSQVRLPWKINDRRNEVPDYCLGILDTNGHLLLLGGLEIKIATLEMQGLPEPQDIANEPAVRYAFTRASLQADDQIKAAIKNGALPRNKAIRWIVAIGPYFIIQEAEFSEAELRTRSHKRNLPQDDADADLIAKTRNIVGNAFHMPLQGQLYRIGTKEAARAVHQFLLYGNTLPRDPNR
jgi:hypothetical protein